ncbi:unnamed protein product [Callosobruchus maculatus]|uniref:C2H2-type domain-containing protein n=1 Tax=Callosobruchus maculatus TaxID=64391 RepID=A0A653BGD3_CALMS|nr:unnamed protein product [Callosobruchus maculatus]
MKIQTTPVAENRMQNAPNIIALVFMRGTQSSANNVFRVLQNEKASPKTTSIIILEEYRAGMEDGPNSVLSAVEIPSISRNGVVSPIMAKISHENSNPSEDKVNDLTKINGNTVSENLFENNDSYDSESDALVIDESLPKKKKHQKKKPLSSTAQCQNIPEVTKSEESENHQEELPLDIAQEELNNTQEEQIYPEEIPDIITHSNPFFNESLFELSQQHHNSQEDIGSQSEAVDKTKSKTQKRVKVKQKPKLKEYAQYLGLQPNVQFKCSKCGKAGFESLATLHEHLVQCNAESVQETSTDNTKSGFKLTRKVFLCSACGTYYENWNLYMHMLEFHRRYICLYCLGMFSVLEDLCQHIQSRHNLEPGHRNSLDEFFNVYNEPCYVVCCECNKLFSEQDNFFYHNCAAKGGPKPKKPVRPQITPENHVTGESEATKDILIPTEAQKTSDTEKSEDPVKENIKDDVPMEIEENSNRLSTDVKVENEDSRNLAAEDNVEDTMENKHDGKLENNEDFEETEPISDYSENSRDIAPVTANTPEGEPESIEKDHSEEMEEQESSNDVTETRKVPKLSLKLPKPGSYPEPEDSDDSEKLTVEVDQIESENEMYNEPNNVSSGQEQDHCSETNHVQDTESEEKKDEKIESENALDISDENQFHVAGSEIPIIELELEQPLDKFDPKILLQKCLRMTVASCIYCNHARKIAVNGRQLALHCIAEHRFAAIVNSITAEELIPESFVNRLRECLDELDTVYFNLESNFTDEAVTFSHVFECFQCYFSTNVHKELYLHNRKFHSKNLLLCIMCKSNFYNYSELICHLCPGLYILDYDLQFRCCMCVNDDLPSAFRLMVHLRKRHNVCDVCLEMCHTQYRLSNHRCLQKKWPHVYHFCTPPASFTCDECQSVFSKAVALKVHKRLHTEDRKHSCTFEECSESFVSKKLMLKHEARHREPVEEVKPIEAEPVTEDVKPEETEEKEAEVNEVEKVEEKPKPKIDVLDLPALNLSESDSSDSEPDEKKDEKTVVEKQESKESETVEEAVRTELGEQVVTDSMEVPTESVIEEQPSEIQESQEKDEDTTAASKEKLDNMFSMEEKLEKPPEVDIPIPMVEEEPTVQMALMDHDYCLDPEQKTDTSLIEVKPALEMTESVDHDYCTAKAAEKPPLEPLPEELLQNEEKQKKDSSSSSSSDSDSCSCGSNCSCSSSSNSSSSSSNSSGSDSSTEEGQATAKGGQRERREQSGRRGGDIWRRSDRTSGDSGTAHKRVRPGHHRIGDRRGVLRPSAPEAGQEDPRRETATAIQQQQQQQQQQNNQQRHSPAPTSVVPPLTLSLARLSPAPAQQVHSPGGGHRLPPRSPALSAMGGGANASHASVLPSPALGAALEGGNAPPAPLPPPHPVPPPPPPQPTVEPISIRTGAHLSDFHVRRPRRPKKQKSRRHQDADDSDDEDASDDDDDSDATTDSEEEERRRRQAQHQHQAGAGGGGGQQPQPQLCPYDEVSEMIGCDASDCAIEWFHFECVGIMVPPKGQWFCPDCRKKKQQRQLMQHAIN